MKTFLHPVSSKVFFKKIFTIILVLVSLSSFSELKTAICTGNYSTATTWSPSGKPACGDNIYIPTGITVSLTTSEPYYESGCTSAMQFTVSGTFYFTQTSRLSLPCNSEIWVLTGGTVDGENNDNSQRIFICNVEVWRGRDNGAGFKYWYVGVLPIDLVNFNAKQNGKKNILNWETATEQNNDYFEVQRSEDGINFYSIKRVLTQALNGNSNSPLSYESIDETAPIGTSYYRIRQTDINKNITYSRILSLEKLNETNPKFIIYPNPNNGNFNIELKGIDASKPVEVKFYDSLGKLVHHDFADAYSIQSKNYGASIGLIHEIGVYMVVFTTDNKSYYSKLILQ